MLTPLPAINAEREIVPGEVVAQKYRFERLLGEGGQGWVWQAHNIPLDAPVAIKVVRTEGADKSLPERLFREAHAAARLGHPGIVRVFDLGQAPNGAPFLVMELLEGETLSDRLVMNGRLEPELAIRLLLPIADALLAAHAKGIVHRDVKPDNVFLAISGETIQPKLLDFGIAKVTQKLERGRQLTQTGAIVGSPAYLSPEQALGLDAIDERADVWSYCATLYECMTGDLPFDGTTWGALREDITQGTPLTTLDFGVGDEALWQILARGLSKSKDDRWPTMFALGRALACWLLDRGVTADVCGVSLESRWLRCEPLAVGLFPLRPANLSNGRVVSSLGALPTGASPESRISVLPSPASGIVTRGGSSLSGSSDSALARETQRGRRRHKGVVLAFAGAAVIALCGIGMANNFGPRRTIRSAVTAATVDRAAPAEPVNLALPALTVSAGSLSDDADPTKPVPIEPSVEVGPPSQALNREAPMTPPPEQDVKSRAPRVARHLDSSRAPPSRADQPAPNPPPPNPPPPKPAATAPLLDLMEPY